MLHISNSPETTAIKLTVKTDFTRISDDNMKKALKYLNNTKVYSDIYQFNVNGVDYYVIFLFRDGTMEVHFGEFNKEALGKMWNALESNDLQLAKQIVNQYDLFSKDDLTNKNPNSLPVILSYVMSALIKTVEKRDPVAIKIMGRPRKFEIYRKLVIQNMDLMPMYRVHKDTFDDEYQDKNGKSVPAKALILRSNIAG